MPPQMALIGTSAGSGMGEGKDQVAQGTSRPLERPDQPGLAVTGTGLWSSEQHPAKSKNTQKHENI